MGIDKTTALVISAAARVFPLSTPPPLQAWTWGDKSAADSRPERLFGGILRVQKFTHLESQQHEPIGQQQLDINPKCSVESSFSAEQFGHHTVWTFNKKGSKAAAGPHFATTIVTTSPHGPSSSDTTPRTFGSESRSASWT
ncbi:MAG: hypothetical protein J3R72DRAFT_519455 [Linnemannia gamsii]|nr:MAG: hypothetical protein J3R72DRAFT_519455 [Linnemannia gamsii]